MYKTQVRTTQLYDITIQHFIIKPMVVLYDKTSSGCTLILLCYPQRNDN